MILQRNKIKSRKPIIFDIFTLNLPVNGNIIIFAPKFQDHDENINHRRFWLHWQLYRRGSTGKRHGDMGRRAQVQFPAILARRQDTPDRTQSIGQGNVETTTFGTLVRLCSARRWSYQVFAQTRLFTINTEGTRHLVEALLELGMPLKSSSIYRASASMEPSRKGNPMRKSRNKTRLVPTRPMDKASWKRKDCWNLTAPDSPT